MRSGLERRPSGFMRIVRIACAETDNHVSFSLIVAARMGASIFCGLRPFAALVRQPASTQNARKLSAMRFNFPAFRVPAKPVDARRARP
jgi:hypothetical protein